MTLHLVGGRSPHGLRATRDRTARRNLLLYSLGQKADFPGYRAVHDAGVLSDFSTSEGGKALVRVSRWAGAAEIDQLIAWGADPNYLDPDIGYAALHRAIFGNNLAGLKELLARGADPLERSKNGRLPSELTGTPEDTKRAEILALVEKAAKQRSMQPTTHRSAGTP